VGNEDTFREGLKFEPGKFVERFEEGQYSPIRSENTRPAICFPFGKHIAIVYNENKGFSPKSFLDWRKIMEAFVPRCERVGIELFETG
jgi:hypothetical protein